MPGSGSCRWRTRVTRRPAAHAKGARFVVPLSRRTGGSPFENKETRFHRRLWPWPGPLFGDSVRPKFANLAGFSKLRPAQSYCV